VDSGGPRAGEPASPRGLRTRCGRVGHRRRARRSSAAPRRAGSLPWPCSMKTGMWVAIDRRPAWWSTPRRRPIPEPLVNALLGRFGALSGLRARCGPASCTGFDRYTSGVLLVAKNDEAIGTGGAILGTAGREGLPGAGARQGEARERAYGTTIARDPCTAPA